MCWIVSQRCVCVCVLVVCLFFLLTACHVGVTYLGSGKNESVVAPLARDSSRPFLPTNPPRRVKVFVLISSSEHCTKADGGWEITTCQLDIRQLCGVMSLQFLNTTQLTCAFDARETRTEPTRAGGVAARAHDALIKLSPRRELFFFFFFSKVVPFRCYTWLCKITGSTLSYKFTVEKV